MTIDRDAAVLQRFPIADAGKVLKHGALSFAPQTIDVVVSAGIA